MMKVTLRAGLMANRLACARWFSSGWKAAFLRQGRRAAGWGAFLTNVSARERQRVVPKSRLCVWRGGDARNLANFGIPPSPLFPVKPSEPCQVFQEERRCTDDEVLHRDFNIIDFEDEL